MVQRIVVLLDGSYRAEQAILVAASLLRQVGGTILFLYVVSPSRTLASTSAQRAKAPISSNEQRDTVQTARRTEASEADLALATRYLALLPARYGNVLAGLRSEMDSIVEGTPPLLPSTAHLAGVEFIVLCRHGEAASGKPHLESVAQQVMSQSDVPLLILNAQERDLLILDGTRPMRITVPLDGSSFAETALEPALQLLAQGGYPGRRELWLVHVVDLLVGEGTADVETHMSPYIVAQSRRNSQHYLQSVTERLRRKMAGKADIQINYAVTSGIDIPGTILDLKASEDGWEPPVSLIALATHRSAGPSPWSTGSMAEHLLQATTAPLLIVCPKTPSVKLINRELPVERSKNM